MGQVQVGAIDMVGQERTARAALLPAGAEHEVVNDQLAASGEEIDETLGTLPALEDIRLVDPDPGQRPAFGAQLVALAGEGLFLVQQLPAFDPPLLPGDDSRRLPLFWVVAVLVAALVATHWGFSSLVSGFARSRRVSQHRPRPPAEAPPVAIRAHVVRHRGHMLYSSLWGFRTPGVRGPVAPRPRPGVPVGYAPPVATPRSGHGPPANRTRPVAPGSRQRAHRSWTACRRARAEWSRSVPVAGPRRPGNDRGCAVPRYKIGR